MYAWQIVTKKDGTKIAIDCEGLKKLTSQRLIPYELKYSLSGEVGFDFV